MGLDSSFSFPLTPFQALNQLQRLGLALPEVEWLLGALLSRHRAAAPSAVEGELAVPLSRTDWVLQASESCIQTGDWSWLVARAERCLQGEPIQYVLGQAAFLDHSYEVTPQVLLPRPETEVLWEVAVSSLAQESGRRLRGIEVGLGSGILSIELLHRFAGCEMWASELSLGAQAVALRNARRLLGPQEPGGRLQVLTPLDEHAVLRGVFPEGLQADFLISNPPYLVRRAGSAETTPQVSEWEPAVALFSPDEDDVFFYRKLAEEASGMLRPGAWVFLEVPHERAEQIRTLWDQLEEVHSVELLNDLTGRPRVLRVRWSGPGL